METSALGRLEKIDLRTVWANEALDFTPWLSEEENLALLGDTIGLDLELESAEQDVGPFSADLLCRDTVEGRWVLVENQLERTDHRHLGQLLTYAAGLDAVTVVWVAKRFTEEHRAALDWLNKITEQDFHFFGLELELWQIGDSPAAPKFNLASKPNDWSKAISRAAKKEGELTPLKKTYLQYWTEFSNYLETHAQHVRPRKPRAQHWSDYAIGKSGCNLSARLHSTEYRIGVDLYLKGEDAEALFHLLEESRETIESSMSAQIEWRPLPERKSFKVSASHEGEDPTDEERWEEQHAWLAKTLDAFYEVFSPRLKALDPGTYTSPASEEDSL